jgi:hypothetical protein
METEDMRPVWLKTFIGIVRQKMGRKGIVFAPDRDDLQPEMGDSAKLAGREWQEICMHSQPSPGQEMEMRKNVRELVTRWGSLEEHEFEKAAVNVTNRLNIDLWSPGTTPEQILVYQKEFLAELLRRDAAKCAEKASALRAERRKRRLAFVSWVWRWKPDLGAVGIFFVAVLSSAFFEALLLGTVTFSAALGLLAILLLAVPTVVRLIAWAGKGRGKDRKMPAWQGPMSPS